MFSRKARPGHLDTYTGVGVRPAHLAPALLNAMAAATAIGAAMKRNALILDLTQPPGKSPVARALLLQLSVRRTPLTAAPRTASVRLRASAAPSARRDLLGDISEDAVARAPDRGVRHRVSFSDTSSEALHDVFHVPHFNSGPSAAAAAQLSSARATAKPRMVRKYVPTANGLVAVEVPAEEVNINLQRNAKLKASLSRSPLMQGVRRGPQVRTGSLVQPPAARHSSLRASEARNSSFRASSLLQDREDERKRAAARAAFEREKAEQERELAELKREAEAMKRQLQQQHETTISTPPPSTQKEEPDTTPKVLEDSASGETLNAKDSGEVVANGGPTPASVEALEASARAEQAVVDTQHAIELMGEPELTPAHAVDEAIPVPAADEAIPVPAAGESTPAHKTVEPFPDHAEHIPEPALDSDSEAMPAIIVPAISLSPSPSPPQIRPPTPPANHKPLPPLTLDSTADAHMVPPVQTRLRSHSSVGFVENPEIIDREHSPSPQPHTPSMAQALRPQNTPRSAMKRSLVYGSPANAKALAAQEAYLALATEENTRMNSSLQAPRAPFGGGPRTGDKVARRLSLRELPAKSEASMRTTLRPQLMQYPAIQPSGLPGYQLAAQKRAKELYAAANNSLGPAKSSLPPLEKKLSFEQKAPRSSGFMTTMRTAPARESTDGYTLDPGRPEPAGPSPTQFRSRFEDSDDEDVSRVSTLVARAPAADKARTLRAPAPAAEEAPKKKKFGLRLKKLFGKNARE